MATYSLIKYDVLRNVMYLKGTPTPDLKQIIKEGGLSTEEDKDYIEGIQSNNNNPVTQEVYDYVKPYLESIPELNLGNSRGVTLKIEIFDDNTTGVLSIISQNLDRTITTINVSDSNWPAPIAISIKPTVKYPLLGKCRNCLRFTFDKTLIDINWKNFTGNLGAKWDGTYFSGQKVYDVQIPDFTDPFTGYGSNTNFKLLWKPNLTGQNVNVFGAGTIPITAGSNKWILLPSASIGTNWQGNETFYHILSGPSASCPYTPNPTNTTWNFFGENGRFLLEEVIPSSPLEAGTLPKECPKFSPSPGPADWGYNCDGNGNCVGANPGTTGSYATLEQCQTSCTPPAPTSSFNCTFNGCVQVPSGSGSFATLEECLLSCNTSSFITTCSCVETPNAAINPDFSNGYNSWVTTPNSFIPGIGTWVNGNGTALATITSQFNSDNTSSVFISQENILNPSCSYEVCFQAWTGQAGTSASISLDTGVYPLLLSNTATINEIPTAYSFILTAGAFNTTDLTVFIGAINGVTTRVYLDNFCVKKGECKPDPLPEDCIITGSAFCYTDVTYDCRCPEGFFEFSGSCASGSGLFVEKQLTGTPINAPSMTFSSWGINSPFLYYYYDPVTGAPSSSIGAGTVTSPASPSPFFSNPNVYNTTFTTDMLKNPFWRGYNANPALCGYSARLFRQIPSDGIWYGGGSYLNISSSKTYYVGLIADDQFRFKVNGTTIASPSVSTVNSYAQPSVQFPNNPYLSGVGSLTGAPTAGNWTFRSLHIYPITLPSGCNYIQVEGKDTSGAPTGFGAVIFDMTANELVNATSEFDLNVIWDSRTNLVFNLNNGITASCPTGATPLGPNPCDLCQVSGSVLPCGTCIECTMGKLYNGYAVDKGGPVTKGRGNGGIVNTNPVDNPINTWVIPDESDWNTLITYLDDAPAISNLTPSGSYGTNAGGKMKDYTRDLIAACWRSPNVGAQNDDFSSGWAGTPGGIRNANSSYQDLGIEGNWWSANSITPTATTMATRNLKHWSNDVYRYVITKNYGCSIRLVRPAQPGEANGTMILDAYVGKNGTLYDGIVIGTQVWITKNLSETLYNNGTSISTVLPAAWTNALTTTVASTADYNNSSSFNNILTGNINPATGLCYEYPKWYIYRKCDGSAYLAQTEPGATTTPGEVQKANDLSCWEFIQVTEDNDDIIYQLYVEGNYFTENTTVYDDCQECSALHTIYMNFGTTNC